MMTKVPNKQVVLRKGRELPLARRHPWIFSGALHHLNGQPEDGDRVSVVDAGDKLWGWGHYHRGSILVKMISFDPTEDPDTLFAKRIQQAWQLRQELGLGPNTTTTGFRLVHGEGDFLPGLIIDIYGSTAVIQAHSIGMYREFPLITDALLNLAGLPIHAIYQKSSRTLPPKFAADIADGYLLGSLGDNVFMENGMSFLAEWETGQKTGFFLDQRENRALLGKYASGKSVLNTFCYTGGFSIYALQNHASTVTSVDVSQKAMDSLSANLAAANLPNPEQHESVTADVMDYLRDTERQWDVVILDPPAFAKSREKRHQAVQGYKRLNTAGMKKVKPGGLLFTFSCSQVVDNQLFKDTILAAAMEAGCEARILHTLSQGADHPVDLALPESSYLKGLVLRIN